MNRRLFRTWTLWLLPFLVARALVPVGFMLALDANGLSLVLCPTQSSALIAVLDASASVENHAHHAEVSAADPHASHATTSGSQLDSPCPYSLATIAIAHAVAPADNIVPVPTDAPVDPTELIASGNGPQRADRIRGPPILS